MNSFNVGYIAVSLAVISYSMWVIFKFKDDEDIVFNISKITLMSCVSISFVIWICASIKSGTLKNPGFAVWVLNILVSVLMIVIWFSYYKTRYKKIKRSFKYKYSVARGLEKITGLQVIIFINFVLLPFANIADIYYAILLVCSNKQFK